MNENDKREIIRRCWLMEKVPEVPFLIEVGEAHHATDALLKDMSLDLERQETYIDELSSLNDFFIPNLKPNLGIGVIAAAFGCAWVADPKSDPWIKPLINDSNPELVYELEMPDAAISGLNALAMERIEFFQQHSRYPLRLVNVPSPLVTASLIWEYSSFFTSMITRPREVHILLEKVTAATIEFIKLQIEKNKKLFSLSHEPWYLPIDLGIRISDDTAAVMSPATYREFGVPYNARISEAFGGIVVHSCGNIGHILPVILEIPGLRGIDLAINQNDWPRVHEACTDRVCVSLRYYSWDFQSPGAADLSDYSAKLVDYFGRRGILLWTHTQKLMEAARLSDYLHRILRK